MNGIETKKRVAALRKAMERHGVAGYLVPSSDPHQSEYVPSCWERRSWLSGFTGSAGDVLITLRDAGLWTDGRYFLQAERELDGSGVELFRMGDPGVPSIAAFAARNLRRGEALGVDPRVLSIRQAATWQAELEPSGVSLTSLDDNLVDEIWGDEQPSPSSTTIIGLSNELTGETIASKLKRVRRAMRDNGADVHVVTTLDAIAWLFNIRGNDVDFNPVAIAWAIITDTEAILLIDERKVTPAITKHLGKSVRVRGYDKLRKTLRKACRKGTRVWLDPSDASHWVHSLCSAAQVVLMESPVQRMKAQKNEVEVAGMRACHVRDGIAMVRFLSWLEPAVKKGGVTEISAASRLEQLRSEGEHFQGLSFRTISGYADHGAIIHYSVTPATDVALAAKGIYLVDSGAQYLDGTTDITRTVLLGKSASKEQRDRFTRVLKGHIALATAVFPEGTTGARLDTLARLPLWQAGLDYNHGTGHGVGAFLNVHEGPQRIHHQRDLGAPLEVGNILSNEPGYYRPGAYGIRIENLVAVVAATHIKGESRRFLGFDTITMCPIDTRLIEPKLMTDDECRWLDSYHGAVFKALSPELGATEKRWLEQATAPIAR